MGYSFRLAARVLLYAPSHTQVGKYQDVGGLGLLFPSPNRFSGSATVCNKLLKNTAVFFVQYDTIQYTKELHM